MYKFCGIQLTGVYYDIDLTAKLNTLFSSQLTGL